jgi:hypothetical protein
MAIQKIIADEKTCVRNCKQLISTLISGIHPNFLKLKKVLP